MLVLVEPLVHEIILDRPPLGCAMLISNCQERGIKTTLIKGQTRYLKEIFVNNSEELWNLIGNLKDSQLKRQGIYSYYRSIREKGMRQFQEDLKSLYKYFFIDRNPRNYFNISRIAELNDLINIFMNLYSYYADKLNYINLKFIDAYVAEILKNQPRYIGFSLENKFDSLSRLIRKKIMELTKIPIIIGGNITPFLDFKNLKKLQKIFSEEYFDYLIIGPGDIALPLLIEKLENKKNLEGLSNVFYKKNGRIKANTLNAVDNLDALPYPDFSQFDLDLYLSPIRLLPLQTARGCSWRRCTFCNYYRNNFGTYRIFKTERIIDTINHLRKTYQCENFMFHDDDFPPLRAKKISEAILEHRINNLSICTYARLEKGFNDEKILSLMHQAGFKLVLWGIESGCQKVLDLMHKGIRASQISEILKKSVRNKIANLCFIIFGFPGETKESAQKTVKFLVRHSEYIDICESQPFVLAEFSPLTNIAHSHRTKVKMKIRYPVNNGMTKKEARLFYQQFLKRKATNSLRVNSKELNYFFSQYHLSCLQALRVLLSLLVPSPVL